MGGLITTDAKSATGLRRFRFRERKAVKVNSHLGELAASPGGHAALSRSTEEASAAAAGRVETRRGSLDAAMQAAGAGGAQGARRAT